jgi:hypothetical protein
MDVVEIVGALLFMSASALLMALSAHILEWWQDVLYGPYIDRTNHFEEC